MKYIISLKTTCKITLCTTVKLSLLVASVLDNVISKVEEEDGDKEDKGDEIWPLS